MKINLPNSVKKIIETLEKHGYEAYAVGGCVRDCLLGKEPKDWDITTSAKPEEVKALFRRTIDTGIQHGTVTIMMEHEGYEVTTYRIDGEYEDGRHPKEVIFTAHLVEDLKRRDFTINAMAYSDRTGVVDEFDGIGDLKRGVIRCVGVAEERFTEDALRILRAVRFSAQLGFSIEKSTMQAIVTLAPQLEKISRERIQAELDKLLMSSHPECVLVLQKAELLSVIFGEHGEKNNILEENVTALAEKLAGAENDHYVRWALFITYLPYEKILRSLKFDNKTIRICEKIKMYKDAKLSSEKPYLRHLIVQIGKEIFGEYYIPYRRSLGNVSGEVINQIENTYNEIVESGDCLSLKELKVNGSDLVQCGILPGAQMGEILNHLFEMVLEDASLNDKKRLLSIVSEQFTDVKYFP